MPTDLLKLGALAATAIVDALPDWAEAERLIRRGHRAAYLAGLSERLGVPLDSALLSEKRLSRAERKEVDSLINAQLKYWKGFESEKADLSQGQTDARAAMYGRATRGTYSKARWADWDLPFHPTEGSECLTNCKCWWTIDDHGDGTGSATWHLGATERHCVTCPQRASDSPYAVNQKDRTTTKAQTDQEKAMFAAMGSGGGGGGKGGGGGSKLWPKNPKTGKREPPGAGGGAAKTGTENEPAHSAAAEAAHQRMMGMEHEIEQYKEGIREQRRENWDKKADLMEQYDKNIKDGMSPNHPDMKAIDAQLGALQNENQRLLHQSLAADNRARDALKVEHGGAVGARADFYSGISAERQQEIRGVNDEVMALTSTTGLHGMHIGYREQNNVRAHAIDRVEVSPFIAGHKSSGDIVLSSDSGPRVIAHEIGHHIEFRNPEVQRRANEFLDRRTRGEEERRLRDITGNKAYADHETAKPDRFISPYMGKRYSDGSTEIISMGVEYFYADPIGMAKADPDYFMFIYDVLRS